MFGAVVRLSAAVGLMAIAVTAVTGPALADGWKKKKWHHHHHHHQYVVPGPAYIVERPVIYAPARPVYMMERPAYYGMDRPAYYGPPPAPSINLNIPLR